MEYTCLPGLEAISRSVLQYSQCVCSRSLPPGNKHSSLLPHLHAKMLTVAMYATRPTFAKVLWVLLVLQPSENCNNIACPHVRVADSGFNLWDFDHMNHKRLAALNVLRERSYSGYLTIYDGPRHTQ